MSRASQTDAPPGYTDLLTEAFNEYIGNLQERFDKLAEEHTTLIGKCKGWEKRCKFLSEEIRTEKIETRKIHKKAYKDRKASAKAIKVLQEQRIYDLEKAAKTESFMTESIMKLGTEIMANRDMLNLHTSKISGLVQLCTEQSVYTQDCGCNCDGNVTACECGCALDCPCGCGEEEEDEIREAVQDMINGYDSDSEITDCECTENCMIHEICSCECAVCDYPSSGLEDL